MSYLPALLVGVVIAVERGGGGCAGGRGGGGRDGGVRGGHAARLVLEPHASFLRLHQPKPERT